MATRRNKARFPLYSCDQLSIGIWTTRWCSGMFMWRLQFRRICADAWCRGPSARTTLKTQQKPTHTHTEGWRQGYSGIFIGGSRVSTRPRRSRSLSSNFFKKGWFCENNKWQFSTTYSKYNETVRFIRKLISQKGMLTKSSEADIRWAGSFCMLQINIVKRYKASIYYISWSQDV